MTPNILAKKDYDGGFEVGLYLGLNEIRNLSLIMNFITINYLFNFYFFYLSVSIFWIYLL